MSRLFQYGGVLILLKTLIIFNSFFYVFALLTAGFLFDFFISFYSFSTSTASFLILFDPAAFFDPFYRGFPADGLALLPPNWSSSRAVE